MTGRRKKIFVERFTSRLNEDFPESDQSSLAKYHRLRMKRGLDLVVEGYSFKQVIEILDDEKKQLLKVR